MSFPLRSCALAVAVAAAVSAADPEVQELFDKARQKILENTRRMPRYTCVETVTRTQYHPAIGNASSCQSLIAMRRLTNARGAPGMRDKLRLDVAVIDGSEIFSWAGAGKFETHDIKQLAGSGASGSGEFGGFLASVFGTNAEGIRYAGRSNDFAMFEYNVPVEKSGYHYRVAGPDRVLGFHGTFLLDPVDDDLQQLKVETEQFLPADAVCRVEHVMDYSRVKIGGGNFLLPEVSTMNVLYRGGEESMNETRFSDCREYVGESKIIFDDAETTADAAAAKIASQPLPSKVRLLIGLSKPINTEVAAAGDAVEGVLLRDVTSKNSGIVAKANSRVHGRILRLQQYLDPTPRWFIAIRFDTIERNGVEQSMALQPIDDGERAPAPVRGLRGRLPAGTQDKPEGAGLFLFSEHGNFVLDQRFHSEWETR
jgi:hypothetical protein